MEKEIFIVKRILKNITPLDKQIYLLALSFHHDFTAQDLLDAIRKLHPRWHLKLAKYRCQKYTKQKMLKKSGHFQSTRYTCLLSEHDLNRVAYVYTPLPDISKSSQICGL